MKVETALLDKLYELSVGQAGYFTLHEARKVGIRQRDLDGVATHAGYRGVYHFNWFPPPSGDEDLVALWLWSGKVAVFSHETALRMHDLTELLPSRIHLTLPTGFKNRTCGDAVVYEADLKTKDWTWIGPVPVTTPLQSVLDYKVSKGDQEQLNLAINQGIRRGLFCVEDVLPWPRGWL